MSDMKEIKIEVPEGMQIDEENSSFTCIKFKPIDKGVKVWYDIDRIVGYYVNSSSCITSYDGKTSGGSRNTAIDYKHCKSMLAMAQISQLMPHYGGAITDEEWNNKSIPKYSLIRELNKVSKITVHCTAYFIAFHTQKQRHDFLINNEQLVKDYLMID